MKETPDRIALVMGVGRSGTTFLAKLIDTAPDVLYRHEPDLVLSTDLPMLCDIDQCRPRLSEAKDYVRAMASCSHWRSVGTRPLFSKSYRSKPGNLAYRTMLFSSKAARRLRLPVADNVPDMVTSDRRNLLHLIKSVTSLGRAGLYRKAVPNLASIHIVRHPCASFASLHLGMKKGLMPPKFSVEPYLDHPETQNYPFTLDDIAGATLEEQVAYRWMLANDKAAADMDGSPNYLRIRYEDLCTDVEHVSKAVFDHLGIERSQQTRRFIDEISQTPAPDSRPVDYFKIKRPITSAVDKWKSQLEPETVERIRNIVCHSPLGRGYFEDA